MQLYARIFGDAVSDEENPVFMTASSRSIITRVLCDNSICDGDQGESPANCPEDCGCGN
jgi:hypothetical protein